MFKAFPRQVAAGVCALTAAFAAPVFAQVAEPAPAHDLKRWLFAEGSTNLGFGFEQEILIANPTPDVATVTLRFLPQDGSAPIVGGLQVQPFSRQGVNARQFAPNAAGVALEVLSTTDIVVERSMYWGGGLFNFGPGYNPGAITDMRAGHNVLGVNAPLTKWTFAEGAADGPFGFQTYVLVSNPDVTESFVQVRYYTNDGLEVSESAVIAPGARQTFFANSALKSTLGPRAQYDFAIEVESLNAVPVVAERAMYWGPNLRGGHAAVGVQPNSVWYFAEGVQGAAPINFDTYILLFNPSSTESINVEVDFFGASGVAKTVTKTLPPRTRDNVWAGEFPAELAGGDKAFSVRALNTLGKPFVAERAVYWKGLREGTASAGTNAPALKWGFADGQEGGFAQFQSPLDPDKRQFSTYYQILNNTANPVTVRAVFYIEGGAGTGAEVTVVVPALSRQTVAPSNIPALHHKKFATFFEATNAVIVERAMYWGIGIVAGHASAGAVLPDSLPVLPAPTAPAAPTLTSIAPNRGAPSGGTPVTITGTGFGLTNSASGQTTVSFGVTAVPPQNVTVVNANTIQLVTPPSGKGFANVIVNTKGTQLVLPSAFEFYDKNAAAGQPIARYNGSNRFLQCSSGTGDSCAELGQSVGGFDLFGVVKSLGASQGGALNASCLKSGGNYRFMFETVAELRKLTGSNRWGLNWKRGNVGDLSEDVITYFWGEEGEVMRNNDKIFLVDMIGNHCPISGSPSPAWFPVTWATFGHPFTGRNGRWTTDPMCGDARYRDARRPNGDWLFPECRPD